MLILILLQPRKYAETKIARLLRSKHSEEEGEKIEENPSGHGRSSEAQECDQSVKKAHNFSIL